MNPKAVLGALAVSVLGLASCGGDEFSEVSATGGVAGSGGAGTGGAAGVGAAGGTGATGGTGGTGAAGGSGGTTGTGGAAGAGGVAGAGGTGGVTGWTHCGAPPQGTPLFYSTLDDLASIQSPAVGDGSGANAVPDNLFFTAQCGNGIAIQGAGQYVAIKQTNIALDKGSLDFWIKPNWNHTDNMVHNLFATAAWNLGGIKIRKADNSNSNHFQVQLVDANQTVHETAVAPTQYSLSQGVLTRITIFWSFGTQGPNTMIWFDKVPVAKYAQQPIGSKAAPSTNASAMLTIGADGTGDQSPANALIDDFKIYTFGLNPK